MGSAKCGFQLNQIRHIFGPWASTYEAYGQTIMMLHNYNLDNSTELRMKKIRPAVSETWVPQSVDPIATRFDKFWPMGKPMWGKGANDHNVVQQQV